MTIADITNAVNDFSNYPPGGPAAATYAVDANEAKQVARILSKALGATLIIGSECLNTGGSGVAQAAFYLRTEEGQLLNKIDAGEYALVCNSVAGDYWEDTVQEDATGAYLVISDADYQGDNGALPLCTGAYTTEFNNWYILIFRQKPKFSSGWLQLTHDSPGALTGADIAMDTTAADTINTICDTHETRLDAHCDAAGAFITSVVTNLSLDKDEVLTDEHPMSIAQGGDAEYWVYSPLLPYGIEVLDPLEYGDVPNSYGKESTIVHTGEWSLRMKTAATPTGFKVLLEGDVSTGDAGITAGDELTISTWVYLPVAGDVIIGFYDNVSGAQVDTVAVGATTWTKISSTQSIGAGATTIYGVIATGEAGVGFVTYIDDWAIWRGDVLWNSQILSQRCHALEHEFSSNAYKNYIPYADFSSLGDASAGTGYPSSCAWLYGAADAPTFWNYGGAPTIAQETSVYDSGNASVDLQLGVGDSFYHYVGLRDGATPTINPCVKELLEKPFSVGFKIRRQAGNREVITLKIITGSAGVGVLSTDEREIDIGDLTNDKWFWFGVTDMEVDSGAEYIIVGIYNDGGAQCDLYLDYVTAVKGLYPINNAIKTGWSYIQESWQSPGAMTDADYSGYGNFAPSATLLNGPNTAMVPISWFGITAHEATIPTGGVGGSTDEFEANGVWYDSTGAGWTATDLGLNVTIADTTTEGIASDGITRVGGEAQVSDYFFERATIVQDIDTDGAGTPGEDATITLHGIYWT